ncbi:MAG: PD-(D/E)XK nuclease family protein [Endomicrobiia bacterium]|nr:PD-(D/E)XK nuclease family protein [Endomicrobiia bacterium]
MKKILSEKIIVPQGADLIGRLADTLIAENAEVRHGGYPVRPPPRDLSGVAVIFPNRRPLYYLSGRLAAGLKGPFVPPVLLSINDLAARVASLVSPGIADASYLDRLHVLFGAVRSAGVTIFPRDFGEFAAWGRRLLETVDEMEMASLDYSRIKSLAAPDMPENLAAVINRLPAVKDEFFAEMSRRGLMTRSLSLAIASEGLDTSKHFPGVDVFYVCGFSDLTELETRLLLRLSSGVARVVEIAYEPPRSWKSSGVKFYRAFDTHSQVKKAAEILASGFDPCDTAVIIPRADSLVPLLAHALGRFDVEYNVSLGYPLSRTTLNSFFSLIIRLQETRSADGGYLIAEYRRLMSHPYARAIFSDADSPAASSDAVYGRIKTPHATLSDIEATSDTSSRVSSLRRAHAALLEPFERASTLNEVAEGFSRLLALFSSAPVSRAYPFASEFFSAYERLLSDIARSALAASERMSRPSLYDVFRSLVGEVAVPFPGVPLKGLQVLGILEARNLKFGKIIVLDVNEGVLPGVSRFDSLLPSGLKQALGLPTYRDREKTIRKNFMTLVNSANEAHLIYREGGRESRSRYVEEIIWEREISAGRSLPESDIVEAVGVRSSAEPSVKPPVPKSAKCVEILSSIIFSPSAIDRYMACPVSFYFASALRLREAEEFSGEIEAAGIGEFAHAVLKDFFDAYPDKKALSSSAAAGTLSRIIDEKSPEFLGPSRGEAYLVREVARHRLNQILGFESARPQDFKVVGAEVKLSADLLISDGRKVKIGGRIDRIDSRGGETWLIDYKTGSYAVPSRKMRDSALKSRREMKKLIRSFQLPVYSWLYSQAKGGPAPRAAYYSLKDIKEDEIFGKSDPSDALGKIFIPSLKNLISEILDPAVPFVADDEDDVRCSYCEFSDMCGK